MLLDLEIPAQSFISVQGHAVWVFGPLVFGIILLREESGSDAVVA